MLSDHEEKSKILHDQVTLFEVFHLSYRDSLVAQLVKNPPAIQETLVRFLGWEDPLRRDRLPTPVFLGFPGGSDSKESPCNVGDLGSIPGLGRSPGRGMTTHSSILAWRIPMDIRAWQATVHRIADSWT